MNVRMNDVNVNGTSEQRRGYSVQYSLKFAVRTLLADLCSRALPCATLSMRYSVTAGAVKNYAHYQDERANDTATATLMHRT